MRVPRPTSAPARESRYRETVRFLTDEHGVEAWWAQAIKHQQADGFTVWASKTIAVPAEVAFDAFVDSRQRR